MTYRVLLPLCLLNVCFILLPDTIICFIREGVLATMKLEMERYLHT
jgi:hypothetical protein